MAKVENSFLFYRRCSGQDSFAVVGGGEVCKYVMRWME